jgi:hypothetical protein
MPPTCHVASRRGTRSLAVIATFLTILLQPAGYAGTAGTITLAWEPNPESTVIGYVVYVGTQPAVYTQTFDVGNSTVFAYPNTVAGQRYYFAVAAYAGDLVVGPRSAEISGIASISGASSNVSGRESRDDFVCLGSSREYCYQVQPIGAGLGMVRSLRATNDGRVFFIEDGRTVRVIERNRLLPEAATATRHDRHRLSDLALDSRFDQTHVLFVGEVESRGDGSRRLDIVRYREVHNSLGEGAAVVSGIELPPQGEAALAVDSAGRIYAAIPATSAVNHDSAYGGKILRFNADGTVPGDNRMNSPVFGEGFSRPTALQWNAGERRLWLAGTDDEMAASIAALQSDGAAGPDEWPLRLRHMRLHPDSSSRPLRVVELALTRDDANSAPATLLALTDTGRLFGLVQRENEGPELREFTFREYGQPTTIAAGPRGALYLGIRTIPGSFAILRLTPARFQNRGEL